MRSIETVAGAEHEIDAIDGDKAAVYEGTAVCGRAAMYEECIERDIDSVVSCVNIC